MYLLKTLKCWLPQILIILSLHAQAQTWQTIEDGILFTEINESIWVFKIDPQKFKFKISADIDVLVNEGGSFTKGYQPLTKWGRGINLNMFTGKFIPNGYTKADGVVIQPAFNKYNLFLVWNDEEIKFLDRKVDDISELDKWPNVSQNIRMIKADGPARNRWQINQKYWSVATIATTTDNQVLLLHSRKPYTMHQFINVLLSKDHMLKIDMMGYAEGGPESSIYINDQYQRMGSFETGFNENDDNHKFWNLPFAFTFERK